MGPFLDGHIEMPEPEPNPTYHLGGLTPSVNFNPKARDSTDHVMKVNGKEVPTME